MANAKVGSRTGRRQSTKAPIRRKCQNATAGVVRRAQREGFAAVHTDPKRLKRKVRPRPNRKEEVVKRYPFFTVEHVRTHKTVTISAESESEAMRMAIEPPHRLAKSVDKLRIVPFHTEDEA